ncbi:MAG: ABC transporter permease [Clostridiales bacterium]|nr:ABC transporter permease [Clostridiales bacterium]MCC8098889.1 ABC transporter permease [Clostridiales bacterium]
MIKYILKRLVVLIPVLLCVAILIFTLMFFIPGDVAVLTLGSSATQAEIDAFNQAYGLDQPYLTRLGSFLYNMVFHLDFGNSYTYGTSVMSDILARFPYTVLIAFVSTIISTVIGIPLGVSCAVHANKLFDRISMVITLLFNSIPGFWLALLLIQFFAVKLQILPSYGFETWQCYVLPCVANAMASVAALARQTRASMLEVIRSDYVTTARAKGLKSMRVLYHHALPNGLIPVVTAVGSHFSALLGGAIIIETIYSIPGLGTYMTTAINKRDYPSVQGSIVFIALVQSIMIIVIDVIYAMVDPRIKDQYSGGKKKKKEAKAG